MVHSPPDHKQQCLKLLQWLASHLKIEDDQKKSLRGIIRDMQEGAFPVPHTSVDWRAIFQAIGLTDEKIRVHQKRILGYFSETEKEFFHQKKQHYRKNIK